MKQLAATKEDIRNLVATTKANRVTESQRNERIQTRFIEIEKTLEDEVECKMKGLSTKLSAVETTVQNNGSAAIVCHLRESELLDQVQSRLNVVENAQSDIVDHRVSEQRVRKMEKNIKSDLKGKLADHINAVLQYIQVTEQRIATVKAAVDAVSACNCKELDNKGYV